MGEGKVIKVGIMGGKFPSCLLLKDLFFIAEKCENVIDLHVRTKEWMIFYSGANLIIFTLKLVIALIQSKVFTYICEQKCYFIIFSVLSHFSVYFPLIWCLS